MKITKRLIVLIIGMALMGCGLKADASTGTDVSNLSPSMAGFSISKDGRSNIIFGVVEGKLAVSGINYEEGNGKDVLKTLAELLGKPDVQTAEAFGGGKENWTEDKSFYIGRIYQVDLLDKKVPVYTTCDDQNLVNSVSIWLINGERSVEEEDAQQWVEILSEFTGVEPVFSDTESEAGSKNWRWFTGERSVTLNWLGDILTINMNVLTGELDRIGG